MKKIFVLFLVLFSLSKCLRRITEIYDEEIEEKQFRCSGNNFNSPLLKSIYLEPVENEVLLTSSSSSLAYEGSTISNLPAAYKESMDWIWKNRILNEKSTERRNLIFDQIIAGKGELNYIVRWQSSISLSLETRQKFQPFLEKQINDWADWLVGFENWPYSHVKVNVVGWAVCDPSVIQSRKADENIYLDCTSDDLHASNSAIPAKLPNGPAENSRFEHFSNPSYKYPGTRWDMYLWGTDGFQGGAGGDWGQRVSSQYIISVLDSKKGHIIEHEMGHGFGMTDFYEENQCPKWPEGSSNIMVAGWAAEVTDYDGWMLRYIWNKIKSEQGRFSL